ncbi:hypothetical protein [Roseomonas sp. AR75]|uniref:hypothetical protein n=1 Tax=Roseomonas sp. AR75 TaxID=2562311 RepID=UPI001484F4B5|nr:hypothetical protein [Roseomonas sp. AR75]
MTQLDVARSCRTLRDITRSQAQDRLPWPVAGLAIAALAFVGWSLVLLLGRVLLN